MSGWEGLRRTPHVPDAALAALVMAIVGMMIIPLPTALLDMLIAGNVAVSVIMLLVSLHAREALGFAAMPTILLLSTLYRLALNVSSTRLILLQADAGEVISAFGTFVVRSDYVVGGVVFLILTLIQFLVVARGAERVAEVGARFTLDAIPGKQLAIEADVRSGLIGPERARKRRDELERESQFYGAMDGAMKFVKGDAVAGIVITGINLFAGIGIGMGTREMSLIASLQTYGLLTIGDGLVSQLPALLVSTSAGVLVTRVAAEDRNTSLAGQLSAQLFGDRRVLRAGALFLLGLALVPGLPALPFAGLSAITLGVSFLPHHHPAQAPVGELLLPRSPEALCLEIGPQLAGGHAELSAALGRALDEMRDALGVPLPPCRIQAGAGLDAGSYRLLMRGTPLVLGKLERATEPEATDEVIGVCRTALSTHAADLLDLQTVQRMLDALERHEPARVRQLVPQPLTLSRVQELLQRLVTEGVSIRSLGDVLEAAAKSLHGGGAPNDSTGREQWYADVRGRLGRSITHALARQGVLRVHALEPMLEDAIRDVLGRAGDTGFFAPPPDLVEDLVAATRRTVADDAPVQTVLITAADLRATLRGMIATDLPGVPVLSYLEVASDLDVEHGPPVGA
ncbi:MAG: flagellar biosynthesis protein FlhA [Myxococcales bacterium]|nr:flagellar biosynthesis protein FlhA [Myxococcales bacterium]MDD9966238.1 flagellar biosynthesis protein FlhA [Myxococcales bacterium]